jgi:ABC-2 type transport system ATP-binding protein
MTTTTLALAVDVSRSYGERVALDRVSLSIRTGEIVGRLGPNGAGKSTLLNLLTLVRRPTSGQVELLGGDPSDAARRRQIGVTPQETGLPPASCPTCPVLCPQRTFRSGRVWSLPIRTHWSALW